MNDEPSPTPLTTMTRERLQQARALQRAGEVEQALQLLHELLAQQPDQPDVLRVLGLNLAQQGQLQPAELHLRRAVALLPRSALAASDLANVLLSLNRFEEALQILQDSESYLAGAGSSGPGEVDPATGAGASGQDLARFYFNLGRAYKQAGQAAEAEPALSRVLELQPQHYGALIVLGDVYKALGRAGPAADCYRRAIAVDAADATAWWSLSNLKAGSFSADEILQLGRQYQQHFGSQRLQIPLRQRTMFEFALANALDQGNEVDQAFAHYEAGNQLARQREPWDYRQFRHWLNSLQRAASRSKHLQGLNQRPAHCHGPRPIFIVSLPRSGSTLVEQVLAAHSQVTAASELPWIPQLVATESARKNTGLLNWLESHTASEWSQLGQQYLQKCRHWTGSTPVFTDKLPGNLPYIGAILAMLPDALVVGVRREAMDVCWSCYRQLLMGGSEFVYDFTSLAHYWQDFEGHMDFWEEFAPGRVLSVQYEDLVLEPEKATRRLLEFAGLEFEPACLSPQAAKRAVNTASAMQVREPIHARGLGHWQRYAQHLDELQSALLQAAKPDASTGAA